MTILILSDTHIPRSAPDLPPSVYQAIEAADMILHAGDIVEREALDRLKVLRDTRAVCGNMDSADLRRTLKPKEVISVGRFKIGLIHGYGPQKEIMNTVRGEFGAVDAIVFGHTHSPMHAVRDGILFLNPGSPTDKIFAKENSYGILRITDKKIEGEIVRI